MCHPQGLGEDGETPLPFQHVEQEFLTRCQHIVDHVDHTVVHLYVLLGDAARLVDVDGESAAARIALIGDGDVFVVHVRFRQRAFLEMLREVVGGSALYHMVKYHLPLFLVSKVGVGAPYGGEIARESLVVGQEACVVAIGGEQGVKSGILKKGCESGVRFVGRAERRYSVAGEGVVAVVVHALAAAHAAHKGSGCKDRGCDMMFDSVHGVSSFLWRMRLYRMGSVSEACCFSAPNP